MRILFPLVLLLPILCRCQPLTLQGTICNEDGQPVADALVMVKPITVPPPPGDPTTANDTPYNNRMDSVPSTAATAGGGFLLRGLHLGDTLVFSAPGYEPQTTIFQHALAGRPLTIFLAKKNSGEGQEGAPKENLARPGAPVPSFALRRLLNHRSERLVVSPASPLLYILNFVSIACKSCVKDYARLTALQHRFDDRLQMVLVTTEDSARVTHFLQNSKAGRQLGLPVAVSDTLLSAWFPHRYLSHTVWIQQGRVKAITDPQYVKEENIRFLLGGGTPAWPVKQDGEESVTGLRDLAAFPGEATGTGTPYYTAFSGYQPGPSSFQKFLDTAAGFVKYSFRNQSILQCYLGVYGLTSRFPVSQVALAVRDPSRLVYDAEKDYRLAWKQANTFCYEAVLPLSLDEAARQQKIAADLNLFLGIQSRYATEAIQGYALVRTKDRGKNTLLSTTKGKDSLLSLSNLIYHLNHRWYGRPVWDETGLAGKHYLPFDAAAFSDPERADAYLAPYGLRLQPKQKAVPVLTLTEKSPDAVPHLPHS